MIVAIRGERGSYNDFEAGRKNRPPPFEIGALDRKLDIQQAIELPNFGSRNGPTELERDTAAEGWAVPLRALGHEVRLIEMTSGVHAIQRTPDGWRGGADPRREGAAQGD